MSAPTNSASRSGRSPPSGHGVASFLRDGAQEGDPHAAIFGASRRGHSDPGVAAPAHCTRNRAATPMDARMNLLLTFYVSGKDGFDAGVENG